MAWDIIVGALQILGALGFFLFGMKIMSEGLQNVAGTKMRQILSTMTTNRYTGVLTGFFITSILQSSSATTVMTVSFVNAGLITLTESAGVMMGANIGTTITGWLVSLIGFKFKISSIALPVIALGLPFLFSGREKMKWWGESIIGFALLFLGLAALKDTVPDLRENEQVFAFLQQFQDPGILSRLMFVLIGTVLTIVMQSSSAAMTLTIALTTKGLPLDIAAAMVLGENIGTTITAELASLVANVHAKRSARIHSLFNIIGVTWMIIIAPFFLELMSYLFPPPANGDANKFALAAFHTSFNVLNVLFLIGFVNKLVSLAHRSVKSKGEEDEEYRLEYINKGVFATTEISIEEARKEVIQFGEITSKMANQLLRLSDEEKLKRREKLRKKIKKLEDFTDDLEEQIAEFLAKTTESPLSQSSSREVQGLLSIINDLERIADIIYRMSNDTRRLDENNLTFTTEQSESLNTLSLLVNDALEIMLDNMRKPKSRIQLKGAQAKEDEINQVVKSLKKEQLIAIENSDYDIKTGIIYRDIFNAYEKVGDHIINVSEALAGNIHAEADI